MSNPMPAPQPHPVRIWLRAEAGTEASAHDQIREALIALRPAPVLIEPPAPQPADVPALLAWLEQARPHAVLSLTAPPPRHVLDAAAVRNLPVVLADADLARWPVPGFWQRLVGGRPLARLARVLVPDQATRAQAIRHGAAPAHVVVTGALSDTRALPGCSDAELAVQAGALGGRPSWYAVALPPSEEAAVLHAHQAVLGLFHRALLLIQPTDPDHATLLARRFEQAGLHTGLRSDSGEPEPDQQVFILDDPAEMGLWYRLAPVTLIGGTISGEDAAAPHPFEAAALGSAILHGPVLNRHATAWQQLQRAGATRAVAHGEALADHLLAVLEPELAARLAGLAWDISTGGAAVAAEIAQAAMDAAQTGHITRTN